MGTPSDNVFAPPKSTVVDVPASEEREKASRGVRLGAKLIDGLALGAGFIPAYLSVFPAYLHGGRPLNAGVVWSDMVATGGRFYVGALVALVVVVLDALWVAQNGQTVGKKLCGIKIVRSDGSKATLLRIFTLRYLVGAFLNLIPGIGRFYALADALFIFGSAQRCLHDYIADTIVVRA